ncbi:Down syndrome cell adhesion molecule-like protein CG42256 [Papilio xuthus]|uniref:Hemolin n=1 Tax=Papilio xuthus TaxID=66420 RepID=A0A194PR40_PAPXU|nr:Down syndrome cell adhesion molecule-like protein CG42256 [Papilio xuthus]
MAKQVRNPKANNFSREVMDIAWELNVQATPGVTGGAALLTCAPSSAVRAHVLHTTWYKDGLALAPMASDTGKAIAHEDYCIAGGCKQLDELASKDYVATNIPPPNSPSPPPMGSVLIARLPSLWRRSPLTSRHPLSCANNELAHMHIVSLSLLICRRPPDEVSRNFASTCQLYHWIPVGRYVVGGSRGDVLVVRDARPDDTSAYSCEAQHALTGEKRRSPPAMLAVSHSTGSMAPRMLTISEDETVTQGGDIRLVCCAIGSPPPTYSWFRHVNGRLSPVSASVRVSVAQQVLVIRRAQPADAGVWTCRAHNQFGEQRRDATLRVRSRLVVTVHPQLQVANSGSSVVFNCTVEGGGGDARVRWLHDGVPVGGAERTLRVHGVARAHRGMYQCFAERDLDSAQAAAELRLGGQ